MDSRALRPGDASVIGSYACGVGNTVRRAKLEDLGGVVALRELLFVEMGRPRLAGWQDAAGRWFADHLDDPGVCLLVADARPDEAAPSVVSCGLAELRRGMPGPGSSAGVTVYLSNLVTLPEHRGRGHAGAIFTALLDWGRDQGADRAELHASEAGRPLYERLGFAVTDCPSMRLALR